MSTDVVVVGGGVIGLAVTNALLRAGVRVTSVFPPPSEDLPAASRAAGAMLGAFGELTSEDGNDAQVRLDFRLRAQRLYPGWLADLAERAGITVQEAKGTFMVANNAEQRDRSSVHLIKRRAGQAGEPAEYVEPEDVPGLKPNPHYAPVLCLHLPNEHSVDSSQLLAALIASAATFDAWTHVSDLVDVVQLDGGGWLVETVDDQAIPAEQVVLCAGSRSFEVLSPELREAAALPELYYGKGVSCVVSGGPTLQSTIRTPNRAFACGIHVVPRGEGRLYLGATNHLGVDHDADRGVQPGELHSLFDAILHQISTDLRETRIEEVHFGYRPIASHGRPVLGATDVPGLSVATGTYRDGVLMAPLAAAIIAAGIVGREGPANPYPAHFETVAIDRGSLVDAGVRDIVSFLHEPRGELPYDRAEQLRKYVTTLFHMAVEDKRCYGTLRDEIQDQLRHVPLNETMHKVFRKIVEDGDERGGPGVG